MKFHKYQAIGNDYIVLETARALHGALVQRICDRHRGLGADGILLRTAASDADFGLVILNPDGSEAEKSGNGLRIFARYLWDSRCVGDQPFSVSTRGGIVRCQVRETGRRVFVEMGRADFNSSRIPVAGPAREVIGETIELASAKLRFTGVGLGNPHCVIHVAQATPTLAKELGPLIERHSLFPNRTNVQFVQVIDRRHIRIEIWERGAGYTLASGSSSCAAAAASVRLGLCDGGEVTVAMPGGSLEIGVTDDFTITMLGAVEKVAEGTLAAELLQAD